MPSAEKSSHITRRRWLLGAGAAGVGTAVGAGVYAWRIEPHWVQVRHTRMPLRGLPQTLVGKRLVQVSDLHVGPVVDGAYLRHTMRRLAELEPDYLVVTGDFITYEQGDQIPPAIATLREGPIAQTPAFAVLGNHDYGETFRDYEIAKRLAGSLEDVGVRVLRNESVEIDGLQIAGCGDLWAGECHLTHTLSGVETTRPAVFLAHNPDIADLPYWGDFRGWILSGHTHGGQCWFPLLGTPVLPVRNRRYSAGHVRLADGRDLYVNRGLGYKRRVRLGVWPEVTVFTLARA